MPGEANEISRNFLNIPSCNIRRKPLNYQHTYNYPCSGGLLGCWLPETRGRPLPESVREMLVDKTKKMEMQHV